jgi:hypothetical protein
MLPSLHEGTEPRVKAQEQRALSSSWRRAIYPTDDLPPGRKPPQELGK